MKKIEMTELRVVSAGDEGYFENVRYFASDFISWENNGKSGWLRLNLLKGYLLWDEEGFHFAEDTDPKTKGARDFNFSDLFCAINKLFGFFGTIR